MGKKPKKCNFSKLTDENLQKATEKKLSQTPEKPKELRKSPKGSKNLTSREDSSLLDGTSGSEVSSYLEESSNNADSLYSAEPQNAENMEQVYKPSEQIDTKMSELAVVTGKQQKPKNNPKSDSSQKTDKLFSSNPVTVKQQPNPVSYASKMQKNAGFISSRNPEDGFIQSVNPKGPEGQITKQNLSINVENPAWVKSTTPQTRKKPFNNAACNSAVESQLPPQFSSPFNVNATEFQPQKSEFRNEDSYSQHNIQPSFTDYVYRSDDIWPEENAKSDETEANTSISFYPDDTKTAATSQASREPHNVGNAHWDSETLENKQTPDQKNSTDPWRADNRFRNPQDHRNFKGNFEKRGDYRGENSRDRWNDNSNRGKQWCKTDRSQRYNQKNYGNRGDSRDFSQNSASTNEQDLNIQTICDNDWSKKIAQSTVTGSENCPDSWENLGETSWDEKPKKSNDNYERSGNVSRKEIGYKEDDNHHKKERVQADSHNKNLTNNYRRPEISEKRGRSREYGDTSHDNSWKSEKNQEINHDNSRKYGNNRTLKDPKMERDEVNRITDSGNESFEENRRSCGRKRTPDQICRDENDGSSLTEKEFDVFMKNCIKIKDFTIVKEQNGDLFEMPKEYSLAHCVAEDLKMGSGIAVDFKREFKNLPDLLDQRAKQGGLATLHDNKSNRYVYYLVTKRESNGKPTYLTLWKSLIKMRKHIKQNEVNKLAIPRLGCGLDRLEWGTVKKMIEQIFTGIDIDITVCNFQQSEEFTPKKSNTIKRVYETYPITDIEQGTLILYLSTENGDISQEMEELDKKINFLPKFKAERKNLGDVIHFEDKVKNYVLCGCIVRKSLAEEINYKTLQRCVQGIHKLNKNYGDKAFVYVGFQWMDTRDYNDDLINEKVINLLGSSLRLVDLYVCKGPLSKIESEGWGRKSLP